MKDLYLYDRRPVRLGEPIAQGAEGEVYALADDDGVCVKVHHDRGEALGRRHDAATRLPPTGLALAEGGYWRVTWPRHVVYDEHGIPYGALMGRVRGVQLTEVFDAETHTAALDDPTWATCLNIAHDIASVFAELHRARVVVGDISPKKDAPEVRTLRSLCDPNTPA